LVSLNITSAAHPLLTSSFSVQEILPHAQGEEDARPSPCGRYAPSRILRCWP
jgi:hypothetical protein